MDNGPQDWDSVSNSGFSYPYKKTLLSSKDCTTVEDLIRWIADDAQYQSSQYIEETKVDCEGE